MKQFPFLRLPQAIFLLRVSVALVFLAHAIVRVANGSIPQFGGFLEAKGLVPGTAIVWVLTAFEILGGLALAAGYAVRWLSAGFILMLLAGIVLIHAPLGWFVGEHGTGGVEYSFILIVALLAVAAGDKQ